LRFFEKFGITSRPRQRYYCDEFTRDFLRVSAQSAQVPSNAKITSELTWMPQNLKALSLEFVRILVLNAWPWNISTLSSYDSRQRNNMQRYKNVDFKTGNLKLDSGIKIRAPEIQIQQLWGQFVWSATKHFSSIETLKHYRVLVL
jgi:hypothetical protein